VFPAVSVPFIDPVTTPVVGFGDVCVGDAVGGAVTATAVNGRTAAVAATVVAAV
jgi:hypothetical protein